MKIKLLTALAVLATAGVVSANIMVPNGDFETAGGADWNSASGPGGAFSYPASGGNPGGYGQMDSAAGDWAVFVATDGSGTGNELIPLSYFGLGLAAGDTITVEMDMIQFSGDAGETAGLKMESWTTGGVISDSGDVKLAVAASWTTYSWDYTIAAGATHLKFVPVQHNGLSVGYDNVGVVPEPATMGLLAVAAGFLMFVRRFRA